MLIRSKFEGYKAGIRLYPGKGGDAPPPPDYQAAAKATAEGNLEAAKYTTAANRINQYTPYGSLTYTKKRLGLTKLVMTGRCKIIKNHKVNRDQQGLVDFYLKVMGIIAME